MSLIEQAEKERAEWHATVAAEAKKTRNSLIEVLMNLTEEDSSKQILMPSKRFSSQTKAEIWPDGYRGSEFSFLFCHAWQALPFDDEKEETIEEKRKRLLMWIEEKTLLIQ